jgi:predicted kinase
MHDDGFVYDEITGKPIVNAYDIILHHIIELTEENVNDYDISLNPQNIQIVSHRTHNLIHNKLGYAHRQVFLVYGSPLSGKSTWVKDNMVEGDLIIDVDSIWQCVSGLNRYQKPARLKGIVFKLRDELLNAVKYRLGKWNNAYVIGGYPLQSERERLSKELGAREIFIDTSKEECLKRLEALDDGRDKEEWAKYIEEWHKRFNLL